MAKKPKDEPETETGTAQADKPKSDGNTPQGGAADQARAAPSNGKSPALNVLVQYVKDLSFESPGAPQSLRGQKAQPNINVNVNVNAHGIAEKEYDVTLTLNAKAEANGKVLFNIELVYGGVFRVDGFPQEHLLPILFIECPRLLFPFARQVIAESTRNGGFWPLLLDPVDFAQMFQKKVAEEQARTKVQTS